MKKSKFIGHLTIVLKHKHWVGKYCRMAGIPWQGFVHDLSKFSPAEFWEGVKYYNGTRSPIDECKNYNGISMAWMHHRGRNKHHYEYWIDYLDDGGIPHQMPYKYALEMVCDYLGAGRAYNGKNFSYDKELKWWLKKSETAKIHEQTKLFVGWVLMECAETNSAKIALSRAAEFYDESVRYFQSIN